MAKQKTDADLIQIVDVALADASMRAGRHLVCRPGCSQCCVGSFAINPLDTDRLRRGALYLAEQEPERFEHLAERIKTSVGRTSATFPGDPLTGILDPSPDAREKFADFANDEVCPVLDPATGTCDLYAYRPMTCRVFGPPVRALNAEDEDGQALAEGLGVCELCFTEAGADEIAAAELIADPTDLESVVLEQFLADGGNAGETIVAYALSASAGPGDPNEIGTAKFC